MALASREPFASRRFQLVRHLGAGGMGTVFEAIDRETGGRVALKTVRAANPLALLYLKNEFRALQDVRHENLVELRDLVEEDGRFLVSMELVQGVDFLTYVRGAESWSALSGVSETRRIPSAADGASLSARSEAPRLAAGSFDEARLRNAFAQLAAGLSALHASGKLHRDVKPSNILVTREGRVVLVDFGLATDLHAVGSGGEARGIGTQAFSAPEQYAGQTLSAAADWFSAGVVLYVALSGVLPFHGEIARRRARGSFEPIERLCPDAPDDLRRLCTDLLEPEPERRPSARDVLGRLGRAEGYAEAAGGGAVFVGRERELSALERALSDSRVHAVTTFVVGDSGVGKSTLVQRAIERVSEPTLLVLRGRCYERELVPYKALDGIVDELSHFLARLDEPTLLRLLPDSAGVLARLFPVLERVPAFARLPSELLGDPLELRAHAFATLRQLIYAIAERQPTLLYIDDLQWADADSYLLLSDLLREPRSPKICLIATARPSGVAVPERAALLAQTLADVRRIELSALGPADARSLAQTLVAGQNAELAQAIADEAAGHPLFVVTLAEHASRAGTFSAGQLKLDDALWARVERVDGAARRILELLSTAGAPLEPAFLRAAAAAEPEAYAQSSSALRAARLVRSSGDERTATRIEPYHDRVRETVLGRLDDDARRSCHRRLAETLEASGRAALDPEALVRHLEGAGFAQRAATQAERAAERASTALAFEQAAELYQVALRLGSFEASALHRLHVQLAQALTNAGRAAEAAAAYLRCAEHAVGAERLLYRRLAADHMLRSGHLEQGLEILSDVLQGLGERLPSPRQAVLRTLAWRFRRRVRGLDWIPRSTAELPAAELERIDAYHAVGVSLALIDPIRGGYFEERALALALEAGEPLRLGAALVMEQGYLASVGESGQLAARSLQVEVDKIEALTRDPYHAAINRMLQGFRDFHAGAFARAAERLDASHATFRALPGTYFEQVFCHNFRLISLKNQGELGLLQAGFFDWVRAAERHGDRFSEASLRFNLNNVWLARDEPAEALRDLERVDWVKPHAGYHMQHWYKQHARAELELYAGRAASWLGEFRKVFGAMSRSLIMRMRLHRCLARWLLGRLILAGLAADRPDPRALAAVTKLATELARERVGFARCWSRLLSAGVAERGGQASAAREFLRSALREAELTDLPHCAAAARFWLAKRTGGSLEDARAAHAWFAAQGIVKPERMALVWAPGFA